MLWAVDVIDAASKQRGQGHGMVLVVVVVGVGRGGAPGFPDGLEVGVFETVPVGLIPEVVEERDKLPGGARRPPGEAGEVGGQSQQGIIAAAGGSEDVVEYVASLLRCRQILPLESHVDAGLAADVARVEGMCLELGVGGVSQEGLEGGHLGITAVRTILPTTFRFLPITLRL
ncbi:thiosulfate sulfurtransferase rhodanese-like domain-containing protein 2, putative [Babesia ovata]|uniref:Thiosulfate sulfurtransferase rhodanese-like domain-containing protein 2, putative n=1 Tax=Babesia ovata TaxID=189622 RepID=A0A2H6KG34_9APIC|nr:thiosulfate sulfurtransferase rhodanese-like domain-containing protein 2, putative [Babesia ovata]GBE61958.1 thiosulfate sulfurtransferase rhodanese-like domain-containing protein 2, putative [Babesia ovata]